MREAQRRPKVPDTMVYTDEERELARQKQQEVHNAKKSKRTKLIASVAGGAVLLAGGTFAGMKFAGGGDSGPAPDREPAASAPQNPGETEVKTVEWGADATELLDTWQLAQNFHDQQAQFLIAGIDTSTVDSDRQFEIGQEAYIDEISAPIDQAFLDAWLAPGWEKNPTLVEKADNWIALAHQTRDLRLRTDSPDDEELFTQAYETTSITVDAQDEMVVRTEWQCVMNTDKNRAEEIFPDIVDACRTGSYTFTFTEVDGKAKISNITN